MAASLPQTPETTYRVHFQDCDPLGHLNNGGVVPWGY